VRTLRYRITSCHETDIPVVAQLAGREVQASVRGLVIEASSEDGSMGHTFRLSDVAAEDMAEATAEFAPGSQLTVTLTGTSVDHDER
jgi:hypothetical protein